MVEDNIKEHKNALETRVRTFKELSKRGRWTVNFGILLWLIGIAIYFPLALLETPTTTAMTGLLLPFGAGFLIVFIGRHLIESKGIPRVPRLYLSPDEKIFLAIFDGLTFLEAYLKKDLEPAKYQCLNELREAHELMEEHWVPSEIKVIMKEIGNEIETFKENFEENLIYTVERGTKKETIQATYNILNELEEYLIDPSKEKLVDLNKKMGSLPHSEIVKPRYAIVDLLKQHQLHRHAIVVGLILAAGFIPALLGVHYGVFSIDAAVVLFVGISGPSIAIYLDYILKKQGSVVKAIG